MSGKIYFQWQNEFLRKTIYPLREMKLRHFLLYYKEIDVWREYKSKKITELRKEVDALVATQNQAIAGMHVAEQEERDYFCNRDTLSIPDELENLDVAALNKWLTTLHGGFRIYFPKFRERYERDHDEKALDRNEGVYLIMRVADGEQYRKDLKQQIVRKKSLLAGVHPDRYAEKEREIQILETDVLPRLEEELGHLKKFTSAKSRLVKRKEEFDKRQQENAKKLKKFSDRLTQLEKEIASLEGKKTAATREIGYLTAVQNLDQVLHDWIKVNISDEIRQFFTQRESPVQNSILEIVIETVRAVMQTTGNGLHQDLALRLQQWIEQDKPHPEQLSAWIKEQAAKLRRLPEELDRQIDALEARTEAMSVGSPRRMNHFLARNILMGPALKSILVKQVERLDDLLMIITYLRQSPANLKARLTQEQAKLVSIEKDLQKKKDEQHQLIRDMAAVKAALRVRRDKYLSGFVPQHGELSVAKDIVPFKAQQEYTRLEKLSHDELLREIYARFRQEPDRFPLWLQYMVVHFSGMRYASAHGSWADPRDMLLSLRTLELQDEFRKSWNPGWDDEGKSDAEILTDCEVRLAVYEPVVQGTKGSRSVAGLPALARAAASGSADPDRPNALRQRINDYVRLLMADSPDTRRKALLDLMLDEANYEIREMKQEEVLEELKEFKDKIPPEMWNEIVKMTDLRLTEVNSEDWETLKPKEQEQRLTVKYATMSKYREILNRWKEKNLTGWRQEHERSNQLVVTRAVCNEVAEHIQHLRGHKAAGGLAEKPFWYKDAETRFYETNPRPPEQPAYFVRAKDRNDFEIGASILWLRFVHDVPNPWRIARSIHTRRGEGLIAKEYLGRKLDSGGWVYNLNEPISRTRHKITTSKKKGARLGGKETQYLRWMHEATVAAVEETAEGWVVLTFETALPYEDPSMATVGMFKRYLNNLTSDLGEDAYNPAFVGFVPERALPPIEWEGLEAMLDWNHILLDDVMSEAELETYRKKYIRNWKPPRPTIQVVDEREAELKKGKAHLPIEEFVKWTDELASDPNNNLWKVRIWGEPEMKHKYSVRIFEGRDYGSNFQAVGLWNSVDARGAVAYHITIGRDDIDKLMAMQIEDEYEEKRKGKGDWRKQKMDWLCKDEGTIFFTKGGPGWGSAKTIMWGTVALGGNLVQVERFEDVEFKIGKERQKKKMARLVGFRRRDWGRPLDDLLAEGLVHRCFCAMDHDRPADTPKGIIYSPFLSVQESGWKFAGTARPQALYLPVEELVKPCDDGYVGILEMLEKVRQERKKKEQKKRKPKP